MLKNFLKSNCLSSLLFREKFRDCIVHDGFKRKYIALSIEQTTGRKKERKKGRKEGRREAEGEAGREEGKGRKRKDTEGQCTKGLGLTALGKC